MRASAWRTEAARRVLNLCLISQGFWLAGAQAPPEPTTVCSVVDGSGASAAYPCRCGSQYCGTDEACSETTSFCEHPQVRSAPLVAVVEFWIENLGFDQLVANAPVLTNIKDVLQTTIAHALDGCIAKESVRLELFPGSVLVKAFIYQPSGGNLTAADVSSAVANDPRLAEYMSDLIQAVPDIDRVATGSQRVQIGSVPAAGGSEPASASAMDFRLLALVGLGVAILCLAGCLIVLCMWYRRRGSNTQYTIKVHFVVDPAGGLQRFTSAVGNTVQGGVQAVGSGVQAVGSTVQGGVQGAGEFAVAVGQGAGEFAVAVGGRATQLTRAATSDLTRKVRDLTHGATRPSTAPGSNNDENEVDLENANGPDSDGLRQSAEKSDDNIQPGTVPGLINEKSEEDIEKADGHTGDTLRQSAEKPDANIIAVSEPI